MEKIWYIKIQSQREGPYSVSDLRNHPLVTPDTLVWKEGFADWIPIRKVKELADVFKDEEEAVKPIVKPTIASHSDRDELAIDLRKDPPYLFAWLLLILLLLAYLVYWTKAS